MSHPSLNPNQAGETGVVAAVAAAMSALGPVPKTGTAAFKNVRYEYRSTDDLWTALSPVLAANGLVFVPTLTIDQQATVHMALYAADGSSITGQLVMPTPGADPKQTGAILSYSARYWLSQVFAIPFDDPATEVEQRDPGPVAQAAPPKPADRFREVSADKIRALLAGVHNLDDAAKAAFKAESSKRFETQGMNWSFAENRPTPWTEAEYQACRGWLNEMWRARQTKERARTDTVRPDYQPDPEFQPGTGTQAPQGDPTAEGGQPPDEALTVALTAAVAAGGLTWDDWIVHYNNYLCDNGESAPMLDSHDQVLADRSAAERMVNVAVDYFASQHITVPADTARWLTAHRNAQAGIQQ